MIMGGNEFHQTFRNLHQQKDGVSIQILHTSMTEVLHYLRSPKKKDAAKQRFGCCRMDASSRDMWRTALLGEKCKTSKQTKRFTNLILVWANWRGFPDYTLPYP